MKSKQELKAEFDRLGKLYDEVSEETRPTIGTPQFAELFERLKEISGARAGLLFAMYGYEINI